MRRRNRSTDRWRLADDAGSAAIEFIFAGLILLVPVVYLVVALGQIQGQALGVEAGARHIARTVAAASGTADADARADAVLDTVVEEYGLDRSRVELSIACAETAASCPAAGATLTVTVRTAVSLPLVPPVLGLDRLAVVPVEASAVQKVSRFWRDG
ncbi:TadE family protein [Microbacterium sp. 10M-3C3]|jgi:Flp pilus assembly protein TadG|uniref:TadE family protein n=1 Tax=Microbacterium sp. 10M-3C3 TaxID=2483401 RepID=UPI000F636FB9|nr:TadE family protein [Microbacterium sp. 10M-3C3]